MDSADDLAKQIEASADEIKRAFNEGIQSANATGAKLSAIQKPSAALTSAILAFNENIRKWNAIGVEVGGERLRLMSAARHLRVAYTPAPPEEPEDPPPPPTSLTPLPVPDLQDEKDAYTLKGWSWTAPTYNPPVFTGVSDPGVHASIEGDDCLMNLWMYRRTGIAAFLTRATAWADYGLNFYRLGNPASTDGFNYDGGTFGHDHLIGVGLIEYYVETGNVAYLNEAKAIADSLINVTYKVSGTGSMACYLSNTFCMQNNIRAAGRHLLFFVRLAEYDSAYVTTRDTILNRIMDAPQYEGPARTSYFSSQAAEAEYGAGAHGLGYRIQASWQLGVLVEGLYHAYRVTRRTDIADRLVNIANFVLAHGRDTTSGFTGSYFGLNPSAQTIHNHASTGAWQPVYTLSLVNTLVYGYKLSGDSTYLNEAWVYLNKGTKFADAVAPYNVLPARLAADGVVHHFMDTEYSGAFFGRNNGEFQYTYRLFENGGVPTVDRNLSTPAFAQSLVQHQHKLIASSNVSAIATSDWSHSSIIAAGGPAAMFAAYGGAACVDPATGDIYVGRGGGHFDYGGNQVLKWTAATGLWTQLIGPSIGSNVAQDVAYYPDGKPNASHNYYSMFFCKERNKLIWVGITNGFSVSGAPSGGPYIASFNLNTNTYDPAGTLAYIFIGATPISPVADSPQWQDPRNGNQWVWNQNTSNMYIWIQASNTWVQATGGAPTATKGAAAWDTRRNMVLVAPGNATNMFWINPDTAAVTLIVPTGASASVFLSAAEGYGMVFKQHPSDSSLDRFYLKHRDASQSVWTVNPNITVVGSESRMATDVVTLTGDTVLASDGATGCYSRWMLSPWGGAYYLSGYAKNIGYVDLE